MNSASIRRFVFRTLSSQTVPTPPSSSSFLSSSRLLSTSAGPTSRFSASSWLFFGTPIAVTFSLGIWQVKRLSRKQNLVQDRHTRLDALPLTESQLFSLTDTDFRRVRLQGLFQHDREMLVSPRSAPPNFPQAVLQWGGSSGLQVITPCVLDNGHVIMVNRGWIPHRLIDTDKRDSATVSPIPFLEKNVQVDTKAGSDVSKEKELGQGQRVEFTAVVCTKQERNRFVPENIPDKNEWFYIDGKQMAQHAGYDDEGQRGLVVELYEPLPCNGWPFPRSVDQFLEFRTPPSTHVTYAVTWFSLSAALALLTRFRMQQKAARKW